MQTPSEAELRLLQALWETPGATVQEVHALLADNGKQVGYTTVLTQLQRLHKKGTVTRRREGKQHQYYAAEDRATTEAALIKRLSNTAFGGSPVKLALRALGNDRPSPDELDELERWIAAQKDQP